MSGKGNVILVGRNFREKNDFARILYILAEGPWTPFRRLSRGANQAGRDAAEPSSYKRVDGPSRKRVNQVAGHR